RQALFGFTYLDMQAFIVDAKVLDAGKHLHLAVLEHGSVDPAGGLAQTVTHLALLALKQPDLAFGGVDLRRDQATALAKLLVDAPLLEPVIAMSVCTAISLLLHKVFGHIKADATGADHRHLLADRFVIPQHVDVIEHLGMLYAWYVRGTRAYAGGEDHLVKA